MNNVTSLLKHLYFVTPTRVSGVGRGVIGVVVDGAVVIGVLLIFSLSISFSFSLSLSLSLSLALSSNSSDSNCELIDCCQIGKM